MYTFSCQQCITHLSAALNMPLAVWALSSGGQEERKMSSSFIMERMLEADTSANERSNARLKSWPEDINVGDSPHSFKMRLCVSLVPFFFYFVKLKIQIQFLSHSTLTQLKSICSLQTGRNHNGVENYHSHYQSPCIHQHLEQRSIPYLSFHTSCKLS